MSLKKTLLLILHHYYDLSSELSERYTLVLTNRRELDRVPKYKTSTYIQTTDGLCYTLLALP